MDRLDEYLRFAIELATKSGDMMRAAFDSSPLTADFGVDTKRNRRDLVTKHDREIEKYIFDSLRARYPDHDLIGEEHVSAAAVGFTRERVDSDKPTWIIDPIDGTMNFVHRNPLCCVSIALAIDRRPALGVINAPFLGKLYTAISGYGARCNGTPIRVSSRATNIGDALLLGDFFPATFFGSRNERMRQRISRIYDRIWFRARSVRMIGSACICLAFVAEGSSDIFLHQRLRMWDIAAGYVIVTEAGGTICDLDGRRFDLHQRSILATANLKLAQQVSAIIVDSPISVGVSCEKKV